MATDPDDETGAETDDVGTGIDEGGDGSGAGANGGESAGDGYEVSSDDRTWGILVHASAFAGLFFPFGNVFGPLLVWLVKKEESRFVDDNGKEALNFQITWTVLMTIALLTILVGVGLVLAPLVALAWLVLVVLATVRASEEEVYDYPLTMDIVT